MNVRSLVKHLSRSLNHFVKGQHASTPLVWSLILLLLMAFLLPYFLFKDLYANVVTYGSLALAPLCLAAYFRERSGALITWGVIAIGIAGSLWIHQGTNWSRVEVNNFFFGNLIGLLVGLIMAQYFHLLRQNATARLETEQQRQAKELQEHLNSLKDQLIMHLSHELRTPLTAVQGYLELLSMYQQPLDEEQRATFLEFARQGCLDLLDLITNILDVNTLEEQQHPPLEPVALAHVVRGMVEQWDPRVRQEHQVEVEVPEDLNIQATPQYLLQVLRNLFSNALKYSPPHSRIVISVTESANPLEKASLPTVCIRVKDEGPGLSPMEIPLLFHKFTRLKRDLHSSVPGTGLGLYICKRLVEAMQGHIWVESSGKAGEGSCFCVQLFAVSPARVLSEEGADTPGTGEPMTHETLM
jgi:signal transduction histidine kinase